MGAVPIPVGLELVATTLGKPKETVLADVMEMLQAGTAKLVNERGEALDPRIVADVAGQAMGAVKG